MNGKVILAGEHAVVYGKMALAASISLGVSAKVVENKIFKKTPLVKKAIELAGGNENIQVEIVSELPIGSGLGSSAAVCSAVIKGVRQYLGNSIEDDELFSLTFECEKIAHGNPSGIDPAAVIYGGLIAYTKGQSFERLQIKNPIKLLLVNTGQPSESTKEMVELVASRPENQILIEKIGELVKEVRERLVSGGEIADLLNMNGLLLEKLGVVGAKARSLSEQLRKLEASVKITGAGGVRSGSGMMLVMARDFAKVKELLDKSKIKYFETTVGEK